MAVRANMVFGLPNRLSRKRPRAADDVIAHAAQHIRGGGWFGGGDEMDEFPTHLDYGADTPAHENEVLDSLLAQKSRPKAAPRSKKPALQRSRPSADFDAYDDQPQQQNQILSQPATR